MKSIASVLPHAERTSWVPSKYAEGERRWGKHVRKGDILFRVNFVIPTEIVL